MRTTIDKAGRIVVPAQIRAQVGLVPGPVDISVDGAGIRIELTTGDHLVERDGRLIIEAHGVVPDTDAIRELRLGSQR